MQLAIAKTGAAWLPFDADTPPERIATCLISARRLRINGTTVKSVDELTDHLRVLWLTPSMDGLFTGSSSDRRRFLDRLVLSLDPAHGRRASLIAAAVIALTLLACSRIPVENLLVLLFPLGAVTALLAQFAPPGTVPLINEEPVEIELTLGGFALGLALPGPAADNNGITPVATDQRPTPRSAPTTWTPPTNSPDGRREGPSPAAPVSRRRAPCGVRRRT